MKKIIQFMVLSVLLLIPMNTYAVNDISIHCGKTKLNKNEEVTCTLAVSNLNFIATDITGKVQTGDNLSITHSSYPNNLWLSLASSFTVADIDLMRTEVTSDKSLTIASFKVKASSTATGTSSITFGNIQMGNDSYQSIPITSKTINFSFNSSENSLSSLSVAGYQINFSSDKTNYYLTTSASSINVSATASHPGARVSGTGTRNINYGNNAIRVVVTAEDGSTKTYVINVNRPDGRSSNNKLKSLTLSEGKIKFDENTTNYTVNVPFKTKNIKVNAIPADSKSRVEINEINELVVGENVYTIKVFAENGSLKEYFVKVIRAEEEIVTVNNKLKDIIVEDHELDFSPDKYLYTIKTDDSKLNIKVKLSNKDSSYKINGNKDLEDGSIISIVVTDKKGNDVTYEIEIEKEEKKSNMTVFYILLVLNLIFLSIVIIILAKKKNEKTISDD